MNNIITILIPVFLVIGLGYISVRTKKLSPNDSYVFSNYNFYFAIPILIFFNLLHTDFEKISNLPFLGTNVLNLAIAVLVVILLAKLLRINRKLIGILILAGIYGNVAYMGLPINELLYGQDGVSFASVIVGVASIFALSVGIAFLEYFMSKKATVISIIEDLLTNPVIISVILGVLASAFALKLPVPLDNFMSIIAQSAGPTALFSIGMFMANTKMHYDFKMIALVCSLNLLLLPIITFFLGGQFGLTGVPFGVSLLEAAMPIAVTNFVIAQKYKIGEDLIGGALIVSTVLSLGTVGFILSILPKLI